MLIGSVDSISSSTFSCFRCLGLLVGRTWLNVIVNVYDHQFGNNELFIQAVDCHVTAQSSIPGGYSVFTELQVLRNGHRGKKITCPGARDKLNFRQDKHTFSPNVLRTSKKFTDRLFFLDKDKLFGNRTSKNFDVLARGTSENF